MVRETVRRPDVATKKGVWMRMRGPSPKIAQVGGYCLGGTAESKLSSKGPSGGIGPKITSVRGSEGNQHRQQSLQHLDRGLVVR